MLSPMLFSLLVEGQQTSNPLVSGLIKDTRRDEDLEGSEIASGYRSLTSPSHRPSIDRWPQGPSIGFFRPPLSPTGPVPCKPGQRRDQYRPKFSRPQEMSL